MSHQTTNEPELAESPLQPSDLDDSPSRRERQPLPFAPELHPLLPLNGEAQREQYPPERVDNLRSGGMAPVADVDDAALVPTAAEASPAPSAADVDAAPQINRAAPVALTAALGPAPVALDRLLDFAEPALAGPPLDEVERTDLPGPDVYPTQVLPAALERAPEVPLDGPSDPLFDMEELGAVEPPVEPPVVEQPPSAADQVAAALAEEEASSASDQAPAWTKIFDAPPEPEWQQKEAPVYSSTASAPAYDAPVEPEAREPAPHEPFERAPDEHVPPLYEPQFQPAQVEQAGYPPPPQSHGRRGIFARLFGGGHPVADAQHGLVRYEQKPGLLRVFARRNYQREATLASMRAGFSDLSELMRDIRDGLHATVERQGELLESLRYLPVIAEHNQQASQRLEEQSQAQAQLQVETVRALREQMQSQQVHQEQVGRVLGSISRESRDQKREIDELEGRMQRMREHDEAIASNLMSVSTAVRSVSEQGSAQSDLARRMQESFDERARHLETLMRKQASRQGFAMLLTMLIAVATLGAAAVAGYLYLKQTGAI